MLTTAIIVWLAFNVAFVALRLMVTAPREATTVGPDRHLRLVG